MGEKMKNFELSKVRLLYNAAAHMEAQEKYPEGLVGAISDSGAEGTRALAWALKELSEQAELARRMQGYDKEEMLDEKAFLTLLTPWEIVQAKTMVLEAVMHGLGGPSKQTEVDEVLAELEKKTETE